MNAASPRRYTFSKTERLSSRKAIEALMEKGKTLNVSPFRLNWMFMEILSDAPAQIAFSVPKRIFKRAVDRNRMKRLMRESYRKNKADLYPFLSDKNLQCALLLYYSGKELISYQETEEKIKLILQRFAKIIVSHTE